MNQATEDAGKYVPVMERQHWPTAQSEMHRLLDECARLGRENAALRALLGEWHELFAPVRQDGTEGARLIDRTAQAMASEFRYKTPNVQVQRQADGEAGSLSAGTGG